MEYYSVLKNNEILPSATPWMDLEGMMLSEVIQTEKDKLYDFTYMWNLKNKATEQTEQKQSHRYREQRGSYQRGGELGA